MMNARGVVPKPFVPPANMLMHNAGKRIQHTLSLDIDFFLEIFSFLFLNFSSRSNTCSINTEKV